MADLDAIVVGAGPNGLTAAVTLADAGLSVALYEAAEDVGGGARTEELTLPGFRHDPCSAVHPLGAGSPAFAELGLERYGLKWLHPDLPLAHPFPDGTAAVLARDVAQSADALGRDGPTYRRMVQPFLGRWSELAPDVLRAQLNGLPQHPLLLARFGLLGLAPAAVLARAYRGEPARGLLAGLAAHAISPLGTALTGGAALLFALAAHEVGWPVPRGGSQAIADALAAKLQARGGQIHTGHQVADLDELPTAHAYLLDVSPRGLAAIAGRRLPPSYLRRLRRYRYGPAAFKVDYALDAPVPWRAEACHRAGSVHLGSSYAEIGAALHSARHGRAPEPPFLVTAQPSLFDSTRAPDGKHTFWAYAHVPNAWRGDLTAAIERQLERFAPGFGDLVLARRVTGPHELQQRDANYVGGDIACGSFGGRQAVLRPVAAAVPYATPDPSVYLCSSATPPGPGVHGMCGWHAARVALHRVFGTSSALPLGPDE